jgi:hypothetical protein
MALIGSTALTLLDWGKRCDDDGKIATIINLLSQTNEVLDDMLWVEGNLPTGHKTTVRTGLPSATWRLLNYGVPRAKSTTAQVTDTCGILEAYSEIDKDLAELNGNTAEFRMSEDLAFLEGINQQLAQTLFYGSTAVNPERFMGLAPRFSTVNTANAQTANNVLDAGGTGSTNTSVWLVVWGPHTCHGIFPKGGKSGLQMRDLGEEPLYDANNNLYRGYRTQYQWKAGLTVRDWRYVVRIANIDASTLSGGTPPNLINLLVRAIHKLPTAPVTAGPVQKASAPGTPDTGLSMGSTAIYCNRAVSTWLDIQALNKTNALLKIDEYEGKPRTSFRGIPIRVVDQLLNTETRVV